VFTEIGGTFFVDSLPANFRRELLEPYVWELQSQSGGAAVIIRLSGVRSYALVMKHADGSTFSLWSGSWATITGLAAEAGSPVLWPIR
jgi:hypothetical protein